MNFHKKGIRMPSSFRKYPAANNTIPADSIAKKMRKFSIDIGIVCALGVFWLGVSALDMAYRIQKRCSK